MIDLSQEHAELMGLMTAAYYSALVRNNVPPRMAERMTVEYVRTYYAFVTSMHLAAPKA